MQAKGWAKLSGLPLGEQRHCNLDRHQCYHQHEDRPRQRTWTSSLPHKTRHEARHKCSGVVAVEVLC